MNTTAKSLRFVDAFLAGRIAIEENYEDFFAEIEGRQPRKCFVATYRRDEHQMICACGASPEEVLVRLYFMVVGEPASATLAERMTKGAAALVIKEAA
jgi:hypothetical protein